MELMDIRQQLKKFVQDGCETADYIMRVSKTPKEGIYAYEELGEIVRCRDCKHFTPRGTYKFENGIVNDDCCSIVRGWKAQITPDGFCAWGERRIDNE